MTDVFGTFFVDKVDDIVEDINSKKTMGPFSCNECEEKFKFEAELMKHEETHTNEEFLHCTVCDDIFAHENELKKHEETQHNIVRPFSCSGCDNMHDKTSACTDCVRGEDNVQEENDKEPLGCTKCDKEFAKKSELEKHERLHKNERDPLGPIREKYGSSDLKFSLKAVTIKTVETSKTTFNNDQQGKKLLGKTGWMGWMG